MRIPRLHISLSLLLPLLLLLGAPAAGAVDMCSGEDCEPVAATDTLSVPEGMEIPEEIRQRLRLREMALEGHQLIADASLDRSERERGLDLTIEAALKGDPVAQNNLGYLTATGYANLVEKDPRKALFWYTKALDARYPAAAINIIDLPGRYPELEIPDETMAEANLLLGDAFSRGTDVIPYNFNRSLSHYLQAARFGSGRAVMILRELLGQFPDALGPLTDEDATLIYGDQ